MKDPRHITPAEFQIIEVLWAADRPRSVRQVLRVLQSRRSIAYTTVMTLLDKMARKGSLRRFKKGKAYYYRPLVKKTQVLGYLVQDFADSYLGGQLPRLTFASGGSSNPVVRRSSPAERPQDQRSSVAGSTEASSNGEEEDLDIVLL